MHSYGFVPFFRCECVSAGDYFFVFFAFVGQGAFANNNSCFIANDENGFCRRI